MLNATARGLCDAGDSRQLAFETRYFGLNRHLSLIKPALIAHD
jgi:hypothetical protein